MDENKTLDALDANFGASPLRERLRALLAEVQRLRADAEVNERAMAGIARTLGETQNALNDAREALLFAGLGD